MRFFKLNVKIFEQVDIGNDSNSYSLKSYPKASLKELKSEELRDLFSSGRINGATLINPILPEINYFVCYDPIEEKENDWILLDVYDIAYHKDYSRISVNGFLISKRLRDLLLSTSLTLEKHIFHPAKLRYQGKYLDYYLFQYLKPSFDNLILNEIKLKSKIEPDFVKIVENPRLSKIIREMKYRKIHQDKYIEYVYQNYYDLLFAYYHKGTMISERLKDLLEEHNISGIIIKDWSTIRLSFKEKIP